MGLGVGGIVSVGSTGTGGSGGSSSGIQEINGQIGPIINLVGASGIQVVSSNINEVTISFTKFSSSFTNITSGIFTHGFDTLNVIVQVYNDNRRMIFPDSIIIENSNQVSVLFNRPQSGKIVII